MVIVPAFVWRGDHFRRGLTVAFFAGLLFGVQAWLDSGFLVAGGIVFVVVGTGFGVWIALRSAGRAGDDAVGCRGRVMG
jgi:hypothetical protein